MTLKDLLDMGPPTLAHGFSENAISILEKRYLAKSKDGIPIETISEMFWRVAATAASVEVHGHLAWAHDFYNMMIRKDFLPNSPTLMNAARPLGQLSACFVLPVEDALYNGKDGIYDTLTNMARIHQSGGGTGFSFSRLRPNGSMVKSTTGVASGPVSFMRLYDASTEVVKQGGTRRGANMGVLRVDHPDILEFIKSKEDTSKITNFNISVAMTDEFMRALEAGDDEYTLYFDGKAVDYLSPQHVWNEIVKHAHATGEPGLFFIDEANRHNPVPTLGEYEATNPCGEQCLLPYDTCNLGSINVGNFIVDQHIDWVRLEKVIRLSVRFLDNIVDANNYPLPEIEEVAKKIRRIGLGVMGWADALIKAGVRYGSDGSIGFAKGFAYKFARLAHEASEELAAEKGVFPLWLDSIWAKGVDRPIRRLRNSNVTTVAPTGTISIIAGCSGGIEPLFALAFERNQAGMKMQEVNKDYKAALEKTSPQNVKVFIEDTIALGHAPILVNPEIKRVFVTAHEIKPMEHVAMQAAFQKYFDAAISKTCNFPHEATVEDVAEVYMAAWKNNLKGITVYRDGSRPEQVLSVKTATQAVADLKAVQEELQEKIANIGRVTAGDLLGRINAELERDFGFSTVVMGKPTAPKVFGSKLPRDGVLTGSTRKIQTPLGDAYITINEQNGQPFELFTSLGKAGGAANADAEAISRLISLALRSGVPIQEIAKTMRGISSDRPVGFGPNKVLSMPDGIAQAINKYLEGESTDVYNDAAWVGDGPVEEVFEPPLPPLEEVSSSLNTCPECSSSMVGSEGCERCTSCGYSVCG